MKWPRVAIAALCLAQAGAAASAGGETISLHGAHRFAAGDDPAWADPGHDDGAWAPIAVPGSADAQGLDPDHGVGWVRMRFVDPGPSLGPLAVSLGVVWGADEAYLNGVRIGGAGTFGARPAFPYNVPRVYALPASALRPGENVLAVRIQNGFDAWGMVNGPVEIGEAGALERARAARERRIYAADAVLAAAALVATGAWLAFWLRRPRDRALIYTGAGPVALLYVTVFGGLPAFHAGLFGPASYAALIPMQMAGLPLSIAGAILFVSERRYRALDLMPLCFLGFFVLWLTGPPLPLQEGLAKFWLALCVTLAGFFVVETVAAVRRRSLETGLMLLFAGVAFIASALAVYWALQPTPADWTMRYPIIACFWVIPGFTLVGFGARLAGAQKRLVDLSAQVLSAQGEERRRLSRELHDGVAQNLQAARLGLQLAVRGDLRSEDALKRAIGLVGGSIEELRAAAQDLRPLQEGARSLGASLARYTEILAARSGIPIAFEDRRARRSREGAGDEARAEHLYRIAQEAVGNAIRHGGARHIEVSLSDEGGATTLRVEDDGAGFDLERAARGDGGIGISTMRERAALIGATCRIEPSAAGTRIEVCVDGPIP